MNRKIKFRAWDKERNKMLYDAKPYIEDEKRKTYLEDFLGNFPNAPTINGRPKACREEIYTNEPEQCNDCEKCWGEEMEETE